MSLEGNETKKQIVRDDKTALAKVFDALQERMKSDMDGSNPLPQVDKDFLSKSRQRVGSYGLSGGLIAGGAAMIMLRKARGVFRFPGVVTAWIVGSGLGRFAAIDAALDDMFHLPQPSVLGPLSRKAALEYMEFDGYMAKRYELPVPGKAVIEGYTSSTNDGESLDFLEEEGVEDSGFAKGEAFLKDYFDANSEHKNEASAAQDLVEEDESKRKEPFSMANNTFETQRDPFESSRSEDVHGDPFQRGGHRDIYEDFDEMEGRRVVDQPHKTWEEIRQEYNTSHHVKK